MADNNQPLSPTGYVLTMQPYNNNPFWDEDKPPVPAGEGIPPGGTTGQVLTKKSDEDYDAEWQDPQGGSAEFPPGGQPGDFLVQTEDGVGWKAIGDGLTIHTYESLDISKYASLCTVTVPTDVVNNAVLYMVQLHNNEKEETIVYGPVTPDGFIKYIAGPRWNRVYNGPISIDVSSSESGFNTVFKIRSIIGQIVGTFEADSLILTVITNETSAVKAASAPAPSGSAFTDCSSTSFVSYDGVFYLDIPYSNLPSDWKVMYIDFLLKVEKTATCLLHAELTPSNFTAGLWTGVLSVDFNQQYVCRLNQLQMTEDSTVKALVSVGNSLNLTEASDISIPENTVASVIVGV